MSITDSDELLQMNGEEVMLSSAKELQLLRLSPQAQAELRLSPQDQAEFKAVKRKMIVRELNMRLYFDEDIDDVNTAFSFVVDFEGKRYTVGELFCDSIYSIEAVECYIVKYLMARTGHDDSKLYWQMVENSQLNEETEKIIEIQDD